MPTPPTSPTPTEPTAPVASESPSPDQISYLRVLLRGGYRFICDCGYMTLVLMLCVVSVSLAVLLTDYVIDGVALGVPDILQWINRFPNDELFAIAFCIALAIIMTPLHIMLRTIISYLRSFAPISNKIPDNLLRIIGLYLFIMFIAGLFFVMGFPVPTNFMTVRSELVWIAEDMSYFQFILEKSWEFIELNFTSINVFIGHQILFIMYVALHMWRQPITCGLRWALGPLGRALTVLWGWALIALRGWVRAMKRLQS